MAADSFGSRMREERKRQGLTMEQFGQKMGISGSLVGRYERDEENPKPETIRKFAEALGVSPSWLVYGEGSPKQKSLYDAWEHLAEISSHHGAVISGEELDIAVKEIQQCIDGAIDEMKRQIDFSDKPDRQEDLQQLFALLNDAGQCVALERLDELAQLPKYQRQPAQEGQQTEQSTPGGAEDQTDQA